MNTRDYKEMDLCIKEHDVVIKKYHPARLKQLIISPKGQAIKNRQ